MLPSVHVILEAVGYGVLVPAAAAVVGLLLALLLGGGEPLAIGAGLAAGFVALAATGQGDWEFLRPEESWDWLPALGVLAVAAAFAEQRVKLPLVGWVGRLIVAMLAAGLLVHAQSAREPVAPYWYGALDLAILVLWGLLDLAVRRRPGAALPALLALVALAAAALAELAGLLTVAQLGGVVGGALAGWALVAWRWPRPGVCRAGVPALAVLLPGLLFVGSFNSFSQVPPASYVLLWGAPLIVGMVSLLPLGRSAGRQAVVLGAATFVPLGAALLLAARA